MIRRMKTMKYTRRELQNKEKQNDIGNMHGQFIRQTEEMSSNETWQWL